MSAADPNLEWLGYVRPEGLVLSPTVLDRYGLVPEEQTRADGDAVASCLAPEGEMRALPDPWRFFSQILGWQEDQVAGLPDHAPLPDGLAVKVDEADTILEPQWVVADPERKPSLLVRIEDRGVAPDMRGALAGWEATPHQRFERLLRENESGVRTGILITDDELRLVYAPKGETSGWLSFPLRALATVAGRPMLGGLKLALGAFRLHNDAPDRRLPALLKQSRDTQSEVSAKLAEQVLGSLHQLLRGLHAADQRRIARLAAERPDHLYGGLLTVLLRLVFLLYAEDRGLIPSATDGESRRLYDQGYGVRALHAKLVAESARYPDTMEERRGAWSRLLVLFRLVYEGGGNRFVIGRGGDLFDPVNYPFLLGREAAGDKIAPAPVSDGCILGVLDKLLTLGGERLSYRTLDVEQIGSVYETVMGFTVETLPGPALALRGGKNENVPIFVDLTELFALDGPERQQRLREFHHIKLPDKVAKAVGAARTHNELESALKKRVDERASPGATVAPPGTPLLQPTDERRRTGSHYTPRSLTEPIVRHALEPTFERLGPDAKPEDVLALNVCDPAMGSGAFLVEACRQLASRLVRTWTRWPETKPTVPADEDEELHAKRLVAQRCLYGVDKNPRAVELAKLSLWLATLAREHEFTFLDHALKCGDSLIGLTDEQIAATHWGKSKHGLPLFRGMVRDRIADAMKVRAEIQGAPDGTMRAVQDARYKSIEVRISPIRLIGDAVIAAFLSADQAKSREAKRAEVESWVSGNAGVVWERLKATAETLTRLEHPVSPFHWVIEFPEVFARKNAGFNAVVGNPPFLGGKIMPGVLGPRYCELVKTMTSESKGAADLVAYFFRRSFAIVADDGCIGLLATNSLAQTVSRRVGLEPILRDGGRIYDVRRDLPWPGEAAVVVTRIHIRKGEPTQRILDGRRVGTIPATLSLGVDVSSVRRLRQKVAYSSGVVLYGDSFILTQDRISGFLERNHGLGRWIRKYVNGKILNETPSAETDVFVADFGEAELSAIEGCENFLEWLMPRILAERANQTRQVHETRPWLHWDKRTAFFRAARRLPKVLVCATPSTYLAFRLVDSSKFFMQDVVIFADCTFSFFAIVQSRVHEIWAHATAGTLKRDIRYSTSNTFATFPLPSGGVNTSEVEAAGAEYHAHRDGIMINREDGLTTTYTRFHDQAENAEDIHHLRARHARLDRAVLNAYGWHDLAERAHAVFLDESNEDDHTYRDRLFWPRSFRDEVLARLVILNAASAAEE